MAKRFKIIIICGEFDGVKMSTGIFIGVLVGGWVLAIIGIPERVKNAKLKDKQFVKI